jgi:signal-transduction protein with cAMP-binding, CBS, and nucleotidyltransferase domain
MEKNHVGAIVVKDGKVLKGIITEQDIVRKLISKGINPLNKKIGDIMETRMITVAPEKDVYDALMKMRDANIRHLPVMDGKEMVGLLTLKDILKIEPALFDLMVDKFEIREAQKKPIFKTIDGEGVCQLCGNYEEKLTDLDGSLVCADCRKIELKKKKSKE